VQARRDAESKEDAGLKPVLLKPCGRRSKLRHYKDLPRQTSLTKAKSRFFAQNPREEEAGFAQNPREEEAVLAP